MQHDDGADHDEVDEGVDERDERRQRPLGRRLLAGALGTTVAVAGLVGVGALGVAGLGGLDVVTGAAPASSAGAEGLRSAPAPTEDPYLAGLTGEETPPPEKPDDRPPPAEVPEPVVEVVPLAPGETFGEDADPHAVAYRVPDLPRAWRAAVPEGLVPFEPLGQSRSTLTVPGQSCNGPGGTGAVAGEWWSWAEEHSDRFDQATVDVVVTGWPTGTGADAFADVAQDDALCSWLGDVPAEVDVDVPSADEDWAGEMGGTGTDLPPATYGAARTGDLVVGVELRGAPPEQATEMVEALLEAVVVELRDADPGGAAG